VFCVVGAYAINNSVFDVGLMLVMGILGFALERHGFPVGPVVLGIVLGPMVEKNLMFSLIKSGGELGPFFGRGVAGTLGAVTIALWLTPVFLALKRARGDGRSDSEVQP
jgi:TctA family transporter